ncbi:ABC-type spermidine/putrescine transport system permease subunit II [Rhizobium sp. BK313]|uniref:ABC transporter permease n=1 Tax=Rhizobium sp. BK313 TaxID=2587081 RepID=UPI00105E23D5|nr:ABC transporter permease [Rhizobium sp. BK313]MBB3458014.1 ABC-type spermidine/putrescine transport system permease subunit II [Rhizobium sp. BK313]
MINALHRNPVVVVLFLLVLSFILAPLAIATLIGFSSSPFLAFPPPGFSLQWFKRFFSDDAFMSGLDLSLRIAVIVTVAGTVVGVLSAYGLSRMKARMGQQILTAIMLSPLIFPVIVIALALLLFLSNFNLLGSLTGLIIAHLLIVVPLVISTVAAALAGLDKSINEAAASLGAGPWRTFGLIILPQVRGAVAGAALLSFLFSFNDVTFAAFIGGVNAQTLPLKLFGYIRYQLNPMIGAVSAIFIFSTLLVIVIFDRIVGFDRLVGIKE